MVSKEFISEFAQIVEQDPKDLHNEFDLTSLEEWDSLAAISVIVLVDNYFNIVLDSDMLTSIKTMNDLYGLIEKRVA